MIRHLKQKRTHSSNHLQQHVRHCPQTVPCLQTLFPSARTTPLSNLPTEDPYASDIGLLLGVDMIFEYQLEKETDFLPADGDGSQDELIEHLKKANDELLRPSYTRQLVASNQATCCQK